MDEKYKVIECVGGGADGVVYKCRQRFGSRQIVAIKSIVFPDEHVPCNALREISLLTELNHPNVISLLEVMSTEEGVGLVLEYLEMDLHEFIRSQLPSLDSSPHIIKEILKQILLGVAYCHSHKVIHRDLKPTNILLDIHKGVVKIADFGLGRPLDPPVNELSGQIGTMLYRAPEILLGFTNYSYPVDMWAVGCIFAEMVTLEPLFFPALTENEVLLKIFSIRGVPTEETWPSVTASACPLLKEQIAVNKRELGEVVSLELAGLDLLSKMLRMNPADRISAEDALDHEYFNLTAA